MTKKIFSDEWPTDETGLFLDYVESLPGTPQAFVDAALVGFVWAIDDVMRGVPWGRSRGRAVRDLAYSLKTWAGWQEIPGLDLSLVSFHAVADFLVREAHRRWQQHYP